MFLYKSRDQNIYTSIPYTRLHISAKCHENPNEIDLVEDDSGFDGALVPHALQTLAPLLEFESLVDDPINFNFAGVEVVNRRSYSSCQIKHTRQRKGRDEKNK